jgi:hypothetical protein
MNQKRMIFLITLVIVFVALVAGGYFVVQKMQHNKGQADLIKAANNSYPDDVRYVSFGADYVFAVPKSFMVDETAVSGLQLLLPSGSNVKGSNLDQLYDVGVVAIQSAAQIKANDNRGLVDYINKTVVPDLNKNVGTVSTKFTMPGNFKAATLTVKKDGKPARQLYAYGGTHPYVVVAKERSDAYVEATTTLVDVNSSKYKDDLLTIKDIVKKYMTMLQQSRVQELYDSGTTALKKQTTAKELGSAIGDSAAYINRNIVVPGGSIQNDTFAGQLYFAPGVKEDQPALGLITLKKEDGQWKFGGMQLPSTKKSQ